LGQVVLLSGEGGIGKSRLVEVLRERVVSEGSPCIVLRCSPYHTNSPLYPVIEHLQRVLRFKRDDTPEEKLRKLEEAVAPTGMQVPSPSMGEGEGGGEAGAPVPPILTFPRQGGREQWWRSIPRLTKPMTSKLSLTKGKQKG
jgi:predicted ATPase